GFFLAAAVTASLSRLPPDRRGPAVAAAAEAIAAGGDNRSLLATLAADAEPTARQLAAAVAARSTAPVPDDLRPVFRALLQDRRLPVEAQLGAAAALLRSVPPANDPGETAVLD